jgi:CO/xanthine dehydrogenase FAD-binding subunit
MDARTHSDQSEHRLTLPEVVDALIADGRVPRAEALLEGKVVTPALAAQAAAAAAEDIFAISDARGDEAYRRAMVRVVVRRTLTALFDLPEA